MIRNFLKTALRSLFRHQIYSAINVIGLASGISACILIFLYIQDELKYDRHFTKADRIYRVVNDLIVEGIVEKSSLGSFPLGPSLKASQPEIEQMARIVPMGKRTFWLGEKAINEDNLYYADTTFLDIFDYKFISGNPATALQEPGSLVLTDKLAKRFFGRTDVLGEVLRGQTKSYKVTGVLVEPAQSHLQFSGLVSVNTINRATLADMNTQWGNTNTYTYVLLGKEQSVGQLSSQLDAFYQRRNNLDKIDEQNRIRYVLQPISSIHLNSDYLYEPTPIGNKSYLYIFGFVAVFILAIACINYMNLATARSSKRGREVGLRKVLGAHRTQLIAQFMGEAFLLTFLSCLTALALTELLLPVFNQLTEKEISLSLSSSTGMWAGLLGVVVVVSLVAGSYPSVFLTAFQPSEVLRSTGPVKAGSTLFRKVLVVMQFAISLALIIGTVVVFKQMSYLKNANLGFRKDQVLVVDIPYDTTLMKQMPIVKEQLLKNHSITSVSAAGRLPGEGTGIIVFSMEKDGQIGSRTMNMIRIDYDYLRLMEIKLKEGRNFSRENETDLTQGFIINEAAAKALGWSDPIGKKLGYSGDDMGRVIGVVKDFNYTSLHSPIEPLVMAVQPSTYGHLVMRINSSDIPDALAYVQQTWKSFDQKHPMDYYFLDEYFNKQYRSEEKMLAVFGYFAGLTILIACLGLLGLVSYMAEQRTKEIGIRKVLGSTVAGIVVLLTRDFAKLVLLALLIASPLAWWGMHKWLEDFAYRTTIGFEVFLIAGAGAFIIALLTVGAQAAKAAMLDPVKALKTE